MRTENAKNLIGACVVVGGCIMCTFAAARSAACLDYDPAVVTLGGVVTLIQAYGPPNFGEDPDNDAKELYPRLTTLNPICINQGSDSSEPEVLNAVDFQLAFGSDQPSAPQAFPRELLGKNVLITGRLFPASTMHHHTQTLMWVTEIETAATAASRRTRTIHGANTSSPETSKPSTSNPQMDASTIDALPDKTKKAIVTLQQCVAPEAQYGRYSSFDGGKSAIAILQTKCAREYLAWIKECEGYGLDEKSCVALGAIASQLAIRQVGK